MLLSALVRMLYVGQDLFDRSLESAEAIQGIFVLEANSYEIPGVLLQKSLTAPRIDECPGADARQWGATPASGRQRPDKRHDVVSF